MPLSQRSSTNLMSDTAATTTSDEGNSNNFKRSKSLKTGECSPVGRAGKNRQKELQPIISEEELSPCKSEGSPPRKQA